VLVCGGDGCTFLCRCVVVCFGARWCALVGGGVCWCLIIQVFVP